MKILSILLPTFNFSEGVIRILEAFKNAPASLVEIIINDDSDNLEVLTAVSPLIKRYPSLITYNKNSPAQGPVANWNSLLDKATGQYVLFMHHDEYPANDFFLSSLLSKLQNDDLDVLVLRCILVSSLGTRKRPHVPLFIQLIVLKFFPSYLFKRNVIGSPSCLVVRRTKYPRFNLQLKWLVDVDLYWQLFSGCLNWELSKVLKIASMPRKVGSITHSLSRQVREIQILEQQFLCEKYPLAQTWLSPESNPFKNFVENLVWKMMRVISIAIYRLIGLIG